MAYSFTATWSGGYAISSSDSTAIQADIATRGDNLDYAHYLAANCAGIVLVPGDLPATSYTVTAGSWSGGTATLTIGSHNIQVNQRVSISSVTPSGYNSTDAVITAVTGTQIKYAVGSNPGAWSSGGTVLVDRLGSPANGMLAVNASGVLELYYGGWAAVAGMSALTGDVTASGSGSVAATVAALQGKAVATTTPTDKYALIWNAGTSKWTPTNLQGTWTAASGLLGNGWGDYGSPFQVSQYMLDAASFVHLRGTVAGGTTTDATVVFTLPSGFRPTGGTVSYITHLSNGSSQFVATILINTSGQVMIYGLGGVSAALCLDGISFSIV